MYKQASIYFLRCETPLHAGSGETHSYIDLPIQREKHTGFPKVEGSGLKGSLREAFESKLGYNNGDINILFGKSKDADASASLGFTDARILLFPVKSYKGVMAWITCPQVLNKFAKESTLLEPSAAATISDLPVEIDDDKIIAGNANVLDSKVLLEEYVFNCLNLDDTPKVNGKELNEWLADRIFDKANETPCHNNAVEQQGTLADRIFDKVNETFWNTFMKERIAVLSNGVFRDFVENFTSVTTRNKIDNETGAAEDRALFTIEYLPEESVLYHLVTASDEFSKVTGRKTADKIMTTYQDNLSKIFQIGGNATIGKGIVKTIKL
jgi:CRISPR-associated protein Cmr4